MFFKILAEIFAITNKVLHLITLELHWTGLSGRECSFPGVSVFSTEVDPDIGVRVCSPSVANLHHYYILEH